MGATMIDPSSSNRRDFRSRFQASERRAPRPGRHSAWQAQCVPCCLAIVHHPLTPFLSACFAAAFALDG
jgi:hypothetical protein